jgi:hypothetical protein
VPPPLAGENRYFGAVLWKPPEVPGGGNGMGGGDGTVVKEPPFDGRADWLLLENAGGVIAGAPGLPMLKCAGSCGPGGLVTSGL